jgi:hypothetical protein
MSDSSPRLGLPDLPDTPELYADTVADAFARLDAFTDLCLKGQFVNTPPSSPADGDAYLIGGAPTGAWSGYAYKIATCRDGGWTLLTPFDGLRAWVTTANSFIVYQGGTWTDWNALISAAEASIASAATCDLGAGGALFLQITGTTTITSLGTSANTLRYLRFAGALTLTHNATSLVLPGGVSITTAAGDTAIFTSDGSGNWRCRAYSRASGLPVSLANPTMSGTVAGNLAFSGTHTLSAALTYGGVTLANSVTGTGSMALSTSPSLTTPSLGVAGGTTLALSGGIALAGASLPAVAGGIAQVGTVSTASGAVTKNNFYLAPTPSGTVTATYNCVGASIQYNSSSDSTGGVTAVSGTAELFSSGAASQAQGVFGIAKCSGNGGSYATAHSLYGGRFQAQVAGTSSFDHTCGVKIEAPLLNGVTGMACGLYVQDMAANIGTGSATTSMAIQIEGSGAANKISWGNGSSGINAYIHSPSANALTAMVSAGLTVYNNAASGSALICRVDNSAANLASFSYSGTTVGAITTNGSATTYATTSDARLKNVCPQQADHRDAIRALWVGDFTWKESGAPGFGVLAQQAYEIMPNHQGVTKPDAEEEAWCASAEPFAHLALWGVKDLYALIESLAARVAALEAAHAAG